MASNTLQQTKSLTNCITNTLKTMTSKDIKNYIEINLGQPMRHDPDMLLEATQETASEFELDEWSVLRFMLADEPVGYSHSYGFHTAYGRAICDHFSFIYHA